MNLAFIIGCAAYDDSDIANLQFPDKDATDFAKVVLENCGFTKDEIVILSSNQSERSLLSTKSNIIRTLKPKIGNIPSIDKLFFFFSGHGFHSPKGGKDYLLPVDAAANELEDSSILLEKIAEYLQSWNAKTSVFFMDACRAAVEGGKAGVDGQKWESLDIQKSLPSGIATVSSCKPNQKSYESDKLKNGVFTFGLMEALSDTGKCTTVYQLNHYLSERIPAICREQNKPVQTPYTKTEPLEIQDATVVSEHKINEWRSSVSIGKEIRRGRVPATENYLALGPAPLCAIDLGTSYSTVAILGVRRKVNFIPSPKGQYLVPSVVSFSDSLDYLVGWQALENAKMHPENTILNVKRYLGSDKTFNVLGKSFDPEFIASLIIRSLKKNAEEYAGVEIKKVLVSVPANFNLTEKNSLVKAFELAGFEILRVIGEPCAATIAFYDGYHVEESDDESKIIAIDLGGGTFDVSVMVVGQGVCETKSIVGDNSIGGVDYDEIIARYIRDQIKSQIKDAGYELKEVDIAQIHHESGRVKVALGSTNESLMVLQNIEIDQNGLKDFDFSMSRDLFRDLTAELTLKIERCIQQAIKISGLEIEDLDLVFLAGQGAKIFAVREAIERIFPNRPIVNKFQESAVIQGLCVYTGVLLGSHTNLILMDTNYYGIGVRCARIFRKDNLRERRMPLSLQSRNVDGDEPEFLVSGLENMNENIYPILKLGTTIPTAKQFVGKANDIKNGVLSLKLVETDTSGEVHNFLGTVEFEIEEGSQFGIQMHVDANNTITIRLFTGESTKKLHAYQLNNFFYKVEAPSYKKPGSEARPGYNMMRSILWDETGYEIFPTKMLIKDGL